MTNNWTSTLVGHKRVDVFVPTGKPRFAILYLHSVGLETIAGNEVYTRALEQYRLACVCPHTQRSWWTDRICPEFDPDLTAERHVLDNIVPFVREAFGIAPPGIGIFGVSMGGQGALRLAFKHPKLFPVAAGISSAIEYQQLYGEDSPLDVMYDGPEQCRQDTALLHVHPSQFPPHLLFCIDPEDEPWYRGNDRLHEKLDALGISHTADLTTRAGGHTWTYFNNMAEPTIRFLAEGLERESRRLL